MNRGQIREAVRDILGDQTQGFWKDAELDRYIQLCCNAHAQEALSVPDVENTTSLPGVQEYVLPPYLGEIRRVRWHSRDNEIWTLSHAPKTDIINLSGSEFISVRGEPTVYYHDARRIGLYPVPNKEPIVAFEPEEECETWQTIDTERDDNGHVTELYSENVYLKLEDACNVFCSHVSLWMRRNARPTNGAIRLRIAPVGKPDYEYYFSRYVNVRDLGTNPEWLHFDFTFSPVELEPDVEFYNFSFIHDQDFPLTTRAAYGNDGPQFAVERTNDTQALYFQFHEFRQDIELDFYRNEVEPIETDYEDLQVPDVYHRTLIKQVAARALRKGGRDVESALIWEAEANEEIRKARAQAVLRTRGRQLRTEGAARFYGRDAAYSDGTWRIRPW